MSNAARTQIQVRHPQNVHVKQSLPADSIPNAISRSLQNRTQSVNQRFVATPTNTASQHRNGDAPKGCSN